MKPIKNKLFAAVTALVLALSMFALAACSVTPQNTAATGTADTVLSATKASSSSYTSTAATASSDQSANDFITDAFSNRDLAGTYDSDEAIAITLNGSTAFASSSGVSVNGSVVTITEAGTYVLSGTLDNGYVVINVSKEDKVQLVLKGVDISSETFAPIYAASADKVFITVAEGTENSLANGGSFVQIDDNNVDAVIFSKDDLTINGSGTLHITSPAGHGISAKDELVITGGTCVITAAEHGIEANDSLAVSDGSITVKAGKDGIHVENDDDDTLGNIYIAGGSFSITCGDDGIHANTMLVIDGGTFSITAAEGIEATYITINDGDITITASDDGINAARKSAAYTPTVEINGGSITVTMGQGDTDGVDSNGNIVMNGGTLNVTGSSGFDYDGTAEYNGGTIIVNGQQLNYIPNQMMGGGMGGMGGMPGGMGGHGGHR
ncbi:MAG: carbohydrate-binding domain-containing protein [Clostridia bacterium]|nr:carbohydrate-binding domain-containing protein [Clostridia bacterium]